LPERFWRNCEAEVDELEMVMIGILMSVDDLRIAVGAAG